ncbi:hypothetical protein FACS1894104_2500 [Actinomycetota bacterium]|nr:hypothetical protein FACS1894104_2500 [Actinomycetota bacterium]
MSNNDKAIWVWLELVDGELPETSKEVLNEAKSIAKKLGSKIVAFAFGDHAKEVSEEAFSFGADSLVAACDAQFNDFSVEKYLPVFESQIKEIPPQIVLISTTPNGFGLGPRLAASFNWSYVANVTKTTVQENGCLIVNSSAYQAKATAIQSFTAKQVIVAGLQPESVGVGRAKKNATGQTIELQLDEMPTGSIEIGAVIKADPRNVSLKEAERVVAGGLGFKDQEDLELLQDFADAIGAAVGCSKPISDKGWYPYSRLVGQSSGRNLAPRLFISVGISGATHFIEGMKNSGVVIGINKDKGAPFLKEADLSVVGDLYAILPAVIKEIHAQREGEAHASNL